LNKDRARRCHGLSVLRPSEGYATIWRTNAWKQNP